MIKCEENQKIDGEELIKIFKISSINPFASYLKDIYRDLLQRSDDKLKGINRLTFSKYYELPGIIGDRLFTVFDKNRNEYLDMEEFIGGMITLFCESINKLEKFIFNFYDFDRDCFITKEDVSLVFSYIPLNIKNKGIGINRLKFEIDDYNDRVESQNEIYRLVESCFVGDEKLDFSHFLNVIENINSDIFLYVLVFLYNKKPFSKESIKEFENPNKCVQSRPSLSPKIGLNKFLVSPSLNSKFSPCLTIEKRPFVKAQQKVDNHKNLNKINLKKTESTNIPKKYSFNLKKANQEIRDEAENINSRNSSVNKKNRSNHQDNYHKNNIVSQENVIKFSDLQLGESFKKTCVSNDLDSDEDSEQAKLEGFLYKITNFKKLKKLWFKLVGRDLYYYKSKEENYNHKGMHNLSGVYLQEESETQIDNINYYSFSIIYPKKIRRYYSDDVREYKEWLSILKNVTGYANLTDIYDVKDKLGIGKFGLVRLGIHKETARKVAIKIMSKKDMTLQDLELVKTEIEALKITQHNNIIRLYDVFENYDYIYLIMELCYGGELFSYLEKRAFKLSEPRAANLIHKLATAIYYLHTYGIAHRDLKPENILVKDNFEEADIRIVDFGLSAIIGPNQTCKEAFGTSYVAPEILLRKPHTKAVDIWSIGVIAYLLLSGYLPFDDENSEKEIVRQTIHDQVPFPCSIWKNLSRESKLFVDSLLYKDHTKRPTIKQLLENDWLQKYSKNKLTEKRGIKDYKGPNFKMYTTVNEEEILNQNKKLK